MGAPSVPPRQSRYVSAYARLVGYFEKVLAPHLERWAGVKPLLGFPVATEFLHVGDAELELPDHSLTLVTDSRQWSRLPS